VRFVCFSGVPVPVPAWQIENLKILLGSEVPFTTEDHEFKTGEEVTLSRGAGPLAGLRGRVLHIRGRHKLVISISALNYNLTIDIDPKRAEKLTPA
jgi:transcription antitermination factor NusG